MEVRTAALVWTLFLILECVHIEARSGSLDDDVQQQLRQKQRGRRPKKPKVKAGDESGYVTEEEFANTVNEFANTVNVLQAEFNRLSEQLGQLQDNFEATVNADHCTDNPCANAGECRNKLNGYYCICRPGFGGGNCERDYGPMVVKTLMVDNGNKEGSWNDWAMCPGGSFAIAFQTKLEGDQGAEGDDTAVNNIELKCQSAVTGEEVATIKSGTGPYGTWRGWQTFESFLVDFALRVEPDQGSKHDDSAVNEIAIHDANGVVKSGPHNTEGEFGSTGRCGKNSYICGVATRIEGAQDGDDSGLNDVMMKCCAW